MNLYRELGTVRVSLAQTRAKATGIAAKFSVRMRTYQATAKRRCFNMGQLR